MRRLTRVSRVLQTWLKHIHTLLTEPHSEHVQKLKIMVRKLSVTYVQIPFHYFFSYTHYLLFFLEGAKKKFKLSTNSLIKWPVSSTDQWISRHENSGLELSPSFARSDLVCFSWVEEDLICLTSCKRRRSGVKALKIPLSSTDTRCEMKQFFGNDTTRISFIWINYENYFCLFINNTPLTTVPASKKVIKYL